VDGTAQRRFNRSGLQHQVLADTLSFDLGGRPTAFGVMIADVDISWRHGYADSFSGEVGLKLGAGATIGKINYVVLPIVSVYAGFRSERAIDGNWRGKKGARNSPNVTRQIVRIQCFRVSPKCHSSNNQINPPTALVGKSGAYSSRNSKGRQLATLSLSLPFPLFSGQSAKGAKV